MLHWQCDAWLPFLTDSKPGKIGLTVKQAAAVHTAHRYTVACQQMNKLIAEVAGIVEQQVICLIIECLLQLQYQVFSDTSRDASPPACTHTDYASAHYCGEVAYHSVMVWSGLVVYLHKLCTAIYAQDGITKCILDNTSDVVASSGNECP